MKFAKNVRDLGKLIVAKAFKTCPKSNKLSNLVTLVIITTADPHSAQNCCSSPSTKELLNWAVQEKRCQEWHHSQLHFLIYPKIWAIRICTFLKRAILGLFFIYFCPFKQTLKFLQQIYV